LPVWQGAAGKARDEVIVENRHQPTKVHLRSYINDRYKLTVYRDQPYGELFDLQTDPAELHNRWSDPGYAHIKGDLLHRFINAEIKREPTRFPRIATKSVSVRNMSTPWRHPLLPFASSRTTLPAP